MENVQDIYPLTPLQEGMLFHSVRDDESGTYHIELRLRIEGDLDLDAFRKAWERIVDRYAIFRTAFVWEGLDQPVQAVRKRVDLPFEFHDWRDRSREEQTCQLDARAEAIRTNGYDPTDAPLLRVIVAQTGDDAYDVLWTHHHLLTDAWCVPLITQELFQLYYAFEEGRTPTLSAPPPYRDYIAWTQKQDEEEARSYWSDVLSGVDGPTVPLVDGPLAEGSVESTASIERFIEIDDDLHGRLGDLASTHGLTLATIVQGAWGLLHAHYCQRDDVLLGTVNSGRPPSLDGVESMVGPFINTVPTRVHVDVQKPVHEWLQSLQDDLVEARSYAYCPLYQIKQWAGVPSNRALFGSLFVSQRVQPTVDVTRPDGADRASAPTVEVVGSLETQKYPLDLMLKGDETPFLKLACSVGHYDEAAADRLTSHLEHLLREMARDPDRPVGEVPAVTDPERASLTRWRRGPSPRANTPEEAAPATVPEQVARQAETAPDRTAVVEAEGGHLTYGALRRRADRVARRLCRRGATSETRVGVWVERSADVAIAFLGIQMAGATYVPLDPNYPKSRVQHLLDDAAAPFLVTAPPAAEMLPATEAEVLSLHAASQDRPADSATDAGAPGSGVDLPDLSPEQSAYLIYTSGSTGAPKGVVVPHDGPANVANAQQDTFGVGPGDRMLQFAALGFDASIFEMIMALCSGATLVVATGEARLPGPNLAELLRREAVTLATLTPPVLSAVPDEASGNLPALRCMTVAGDVCTASLVRTWSGEHSSEDDRSSVNARSHGGRSFFNLYGPAEASIWTTSYEARPTDRAEGATNPPIGHPVAGVRTYVLGEDLQPVPPGAAGELYVGGVGVARGYHDRPRQTAASFVPDPFVASHGGEPGARMYRTGDRVRWTEEGELDFLGRVDRQVQVRGVRVEPGEVEARMEALDTVAQAVVTTGPTSRLGTTDELVGYVVAEEAARDGLSGEDVKTALASNLEPAKVPAHVVVLDEMPRTENGKIDRDALPAVDRAARSVETAPQTSVEEDVAQALADTLDLDEVGRHENFFDLGAHSLHIMAAYGNLKDEYGDRLTITDLFEQPTVHALARHLGDASDANASGPDAPTSSVASASEPEGDDSDGDDSDGDNSDGDDSETAASEGAQRLREQRRRRTS